MCLKFTQTKNIITCQRVSAWQCSMGGVAFLWERVNFGPRQNKNHPTDQDQIWQAWLRPGDHLMCQVWLMSRDRLRLGGGVVCHDFVTFFLLFFSQARAQPRRIVRSSSLMAQTIRSGARRCLLYKNVRKNFIFGVQSPKNGVIFRRIGIFQLKRKIDRAP